MSSKPAKNLRSSLVTTIRGLPGYNEMDLVIQCGASTFGHNVATLTIPEVSSGWWEGEAIMGKSQESTIDALKKTRGRSPYDWKGVDSDNGSEFTNVQVLRSKEAVPAGRTTMLTLKKRAGYKGERFWVT